MATDMRTKMYISLYVIRSIIIETYHHYLHCSVGSAAVYCNLFSGFHLKYRLMAELFNGWITDQGYSIIFKIIGSS